MTVSRQLRRLVLAVGTWALLDLTSGAALGAEAASAGPPPESAVFPSLRSRKLEVMNLRSKAGRDYQIAQAAERLRGSVQDRRSGPVFALHSG